jgi:hypothetical protein
VEAGLTLDANEIRLKDGFVVDDDDVVDDPI